ncbi:MAG: PhzF family phenazine biosynthesis protein, partial [Micrococcales bacterium]|nr:PhzF family phenazine biosynthesis protein [Micrococcales bacterium]
MNPQFDPDSGAENDAEVLHYIAFSRDSGGGNRAGLVLDAAGLDRAARQAVAAQVGYSETAFAVQTGLRTYQLRYFT